MYRYPLQVDLDVTHKCNLQCIHCCVDAGEELKNELTEEEIKNLIDDLYNWGVLDITIAGGEPLLRKDIVNILEYACNKRAINITLVTNGIMLNKSFINKLERDFPNLTLLVSLDGTNLDDFNKIRKSSNDLEIQKNIFSNIYNNIVLLKESHINFAISHMLTNINIDKFYKTYNDMKKFGVRRITGIKFIPIGRGKKNENTLEIPYAKWEKFLTELTIKKKEGIVEDINISVACPWELYLPLINNGFTADEIEKIWSYRTPLSLPSYSSQRDLGCHAGVTNLSISANGDVYPCGIVANEKRLKCGNIREKNIKDIWEKSPMLNELRNLKLENLNGNCTKCSIKDICGGGCRARAFIESNNICGKDYACPVIDGGNM